MQEEGEVIFVPSGWMHEVYNLELSLSINHNWLNDSNIRNIWNFLSDVCSNIRKALSDCDLGSKNEWHERCQLILQCDAKLNYYTFVDILIFASRRVKTLLEKSQMNQGDCTDYYNKGVHEAYAINVSEIILLVDEILKDDMFKDTDQDYIPMLMLKKRMIRTVESLKNISNHKILL